MSTIEINYENDNEFFPVPSIYIDMPDCDEAVANEIVAEALRDITTWEDPGAIAMCIANEATDLSNHATLSIMHEGAASLTVNVLRKSVTIPLMNKPNTNGATLTFSAFIMLVEGGLALDATAIARALTKEAFDGS